MRLRIKCNALFWSILFLLPAISMCGGQSILFSYVTYLPREGYQNEIFEIDLDSQEKYLVFESKTDTRDSFVISRDGKNLMIIKETFDRELEKPIDKTQIKVYRRDSKFKEFKYAQDYLIIEDYGYINRVCWDGANDIYIGYIKTRHGPYETMALSESRIDKGVLSEDDIKVDRGFIKGGYILYGIDSRFLYLQNRKAVYRQTRLSTGESLTLAKLLNKPDDPFRITGKGNFIIVRRKSENGAYYVIDSYDLLGDPGLSNPEELLRWEADITEKPAMSGISFYFAPGELENSNECLLYRFNNLMKAEQTITIDVYSLDAETGVLTPLITPLHVITPDDYSRPDIRGWVQW